MGVTVWGETAWAGGALLAAAALTAAIRWLLGARTAPGAGARFALMATPLAAVALAVLWRPVILSEGWSDGWGALGDFLLVAVFSAVPGCYLVAGLATRLIAPRPAATSGRLWLRAGAVFAATTALLLLAVALLR